MNSINKSLLGDFAVCSVDPYYIKCVPCSFGVLEALVATILPEPNVATVKCLGPSL